MQDLEKSGILFATNSLTNFSYIQLAISKAGCIAVNFCLDQTTICPAVYSEFFLLEKVGHSMKSLVIFIWYKKKEAHASNFEPLNARKSYQQ